jgi:hypothetical protein
MIRLDSEATGVFSPAPGAAASDTICTLTTAGNASMPTASFRIDATGSDSTVYQVSKLRNRTVQIEGSAGGATVANADNVIYGIGIDNSDGENANVPNAVLSVNLPKQ